MVASVGIDYSLSSPSVCVHDKNEWSFSNCRFYFLTTKKKLSFTTPPFYSSLYPEYSSQEERIYTLAAWVAEIIPHQARVAIENYSFGSKGSLAFTIGENGGVLKSTLWRIGIPFSLYSPGTIKKFATGSGAADKIKMHEAFFQDTKCSIDKILPFTIGKSPLSDIIDAYWIAKYHYEQTRG